MNMTNLATILTITFVVSIIILFAELLFVLSRRRYFPACSKSKTRVEPSNSPNKKPDGHSPEDPVIDVFKLLEANGPSRVLCTIKEDDREEVESSSIAGVTERVSLQACLESEVAEERAAIVEGTKTVLSSPCDSPVFFTPVGSPLLDGMSSEFVTPISVMSNAKN
ncbi:hypothetical protein HanRHA438_Chr01g0038951 [Helianthus annuus]|nr:hypothetical protein HanRHA438_Chr01g0038951 [Helianthus annuus]